MVQQLNASYLMAQGSGQQYEILRRAHYEIDIEGIDSILMAQDVTLPRYDVESVEIFHYNDRVKVASGPNPSDMRIEILDAIDPQVVDQLWQWFKQVYDPLTGEMQLASTYKRQGRAYLYGPDKTLVRTLTCQGLWPKNSPVPEEAYSYRARHEVVSINMVLSCDRATFDGRQGASLL